MSEVVIRVEGLSKKYHLGSIGTGTLRHDLNQWYSKLRGKGDPYEPLDFNEKTNTYRNEFWALNELNFEVHQGEILGIIGKNGAGKSTLLKILSRVTTPTLGEIKIRGKIASLLEVGTGFHSELTGRENIFLNGAILGMTKKEIHRKLDEIIDFSGVERHIDTPVKRYSSGMYVRLAFAVAAHLEPEILIIDEVLAVGDAEFQRKCLGKMGQVAKEGRTILFVSHNMAAVNNLCETGIFLKDGEIFLKGAMKDVSEEYLNLVESETNAEVRWTNIDQAPGNDQVRITCVRIINKNFLLSDNIKVNEDFYVEIEYYNDQPGNHLTSNIQLYTGTGIGVFSSGNWASSISNKDIYSETPFDKGYYKSRIKIPGNFLNEGIYSINALILKNFSDILAYAPEAITFNVLETGDMRKEYTAEWLGVVRPKLEWYTFPLIENSSNT